MIIRSGNLLNILDRFSTSTGSSGSRGVVYFVEENRRYKVQTNFERKNPVDVLRVPVCVMILIRSTRESDLISFARDIKCRASRMCDAGREGVNFPAGYSRALSRRVQQCTDNHKSTAPQGESEMIDSASSIVLVRLIPEQFEVCTNYS